MNFRRIIPGALDAAEPDAEETEEGDDDEAIPRAPRKPARREHAGGHGHDLEIQIERSEHRGA